MSRNILNGSYFYTTSSSSDFYVSSIVSDGILQDYINGICSVNVSFTTASGASIDSEFTVSGMTNDGTAVFPFKVTKNSDRSDFYATVSATTSVSGYTFPVNFYVPTVNMVEINGNRLANLYYDTNDTSISGLMSFFNTLYTFFDKLVYYNSYDKYENQPLSLFLQTANNLFNYASDDLSIRQSIYGEDFETADFSKFPWLTTTPSGWSITDLESNNGKFCALSSIPISTTNYLTVSVPVGTGELEFYRKNTLASGDAYNFYIDGSLQSSWSGTSDWEKESYTVSSGLRTFMWEYDKNTSTSGFTYLDDILFPSGRTLFNDYFYRELFLEILQNIQYFSTTKFCEEFMIPYLGTNVPLYSVYTISGTAHEPKIYDITTASAAGSLAVVNAIDSVRMLYSVDELYNTFFPFIPITPYQKMDNTVSGGTHSLLEKARLKYLEYLMNKFILSTKKVHFIGVSGGI